MEPMKAVDGLSGTNTNFTNDEEITEAQSTEAQRKDSRVE